MSDDGQRAHDLGIEAGGSIHAWALLGYENPSWVTKDAATPSSCQHQPAPKGAECE